jgi:SNF2 family DNA or RNA helicase
MHPTIPEPFDPIVYEPAMKPEQKKLYDEATKAFWLDVAASFKDDEKARVTIAEALERDDLDTIMRIANGGVRTLRLRQIATSPALVGGPDISGKFDEIERIVEAGGQERSWVWFCWFQQSATLLRDRFRAMGLDAHSFSGEDPLETRQQLTADFQAGKFQIIVPTIGAGGVGIEFFRAADCGFAEEHWVPGLNDQAFGRVDRKGQTVRPQRHIVRTPDTVEVGRIAPTLGTKRLIVETLIGGS